jgi:hypothetical protein
MVRRRQWQRRRELAKEQLGGGEGAAAASQHRAAPREPPGIRPLHQWGATTGVVPHLLASEFDLDFCPSSLQLFWVDSQIGLDWGIRGGAT